MAGNITSCLRSFWIQTQTPPPIAPTVPTSLTAHVELRAPPFCCQDPSMWFVIIECILKIVSITDNPTKFTHGKTLLPLNIITSAATYTTPYNDLKNTVLTWLLQPVCRKCWAKKSFVMRNHQIFSGVWWSGWMTSTVHITRTSSSTCFYQRLPIAFQWNSLLASKTSCWLKKLLNWLRTSWWLFHLIFQLPVTTNPETDSARGVSLQTRFWVITISRQLKKRPRFRTPQHSRRRSCSSSRSANTSRASVSISHYLLLPPQIWQRCPQVPTVV